MMGDREHRQWLKSTNDSLFCGLISRWKFENNRMKLQRIEVACHHFFPQIYPPKGFRLGFRLPLFHHTQLPTRSPSLKARGTSSSTTMYCTF